MKNEEKDMILQRINQLRHLYIDAGIVLKSKNIEPESLKIMVGDLSRLMEDLDEDIQIEEK